MGSSSSKWYDSEGSASFWRDTVPLRTVKRAFFKKNGTVNALAKLILNAVTYDFRETALGGVVIMASDYSTIEFISPDGRLPYGEYETMTLGQTLDSMEEILTESPIPAWDKFTAWLGANFTNLGDVTNNIASCTLKTIDSGTQTVVNLPDFSTVTNMVTFLDMLEATVEPALGQDMSIYQLDDYAFGCGLVMVSQPDENGSTVTLSMGFLFRE